MSDDLPITDIKVPIDGYIAPGMSDQNDWATHLAKFGGGGFEIVEDIAARDAITSDRRPDKMVYVRRATVDGDPAWYQYKVNAWVEVPVGSGGSTGSPTGIEVDDGTTDAASVQKINVKGLHITKSDVANEIDLTSGVDIHMMAPNEQYGVGIANEIIVEPPLNVFDDPDSKNDYAARLGIKHGVFEPMHKPSFLAYLSESVEVIGKYGSSTKHHDGALWFDDIIVPEGAYIQLDKDNKAFGIQEADELDPNITGGTDYLVAFRAHMRGKAPDDGFVRIYLHKRTYNPLQTDDYILDKNGHPMAVERQYKTGDELGALDVIGVVNAKGLTEFTCHVVDSFSDDALLLTDRTEGATGLMIQALASDGKTGDGLQQFEIDTAQNIEFSSHYLGNGRATIDWAVKFDKPVTVGDAGVGLTTADGLHFHNLSRMKAGVKDGHFVFQDDGSTICDFSFGKIFSAEETQLLRGKEVKFSGTITDKDAGWKVGLFKWTGTPDKFTKHLFSSRDGGGQVVLNDKWSLSDTLFISEDAVTGDHNVTKTFTVPSDANNYAIAIYPVQAQQPLTMKLKVFTVDVVSPFMGYIVKAPELFNELHLEKSDKFKKFVQDNQNFYSLRYTLNNVAEGLPMPVGIPTKGNAPIVLDTSFGKVPGSVASGGEGSLKFTNSGDARISTGLVLWNEQSTDSVVNFWYATVDPNTQVLTKIPDSELQVTVRAGAKGVQYFMPTFTYQAEVNDRIVLRGKADKADGAFLESTKPTQHLVDTSIDFKELTISGADDPWGDLDLHQFDYVYKYEMAGKLVAKNTSMITVNFVVPPNMYIDVKRGIKKTADGTVRPLKNMDFSYKDNLLKVSFGEVVDEARVLIGVYL